jgi:glycerol-3-phosphate dehydrogenase
MTSRLASEKIWDIIIIGGGASGMGIAIDAASRGYKTLLLEEGDFGHGTSSRSTKLVHGGVRYLQQGNISLVLEALKERGILRRNAPHLVHNLQFIVPSYDWWEGPFYGIGLKIYDMMAGKEGFGKSKIISKEETIKHLPNIEETGLNGGVIYYDGQFDDARLIISLARTADKQGAVLLNYTPVKRLLKKNGTISGVLALDLETEQETELAAKVVINATGPFTDYIRRLDDSQCSPMISPSQGVHLVFDASFLAGNSAIMVPHTSDGRVLFAIPWHNRIIVGTTDTPVKSAQIEPVPLKEEVEFILENVARYLKRDPSKDDILSAFAGIRPLVSDPAASNTAAISRDHVINISRSGLLTIAGGKWTTYRKMAEDTVEQAILVGDLLPHPCITEDMHIHGYSQAEASGNLQVYGSDVPEIQKIIAKNPLLNNKIHPLLDALEAEVIWAVEKEMARTVSDFLARRTRSLLLNARASIEAAPKVAEIMASEMGKDSYWQKMQIESYRKTALNYIV